MVPVSGACVMGLIETHCLLLVMIVSVLCQWFRQHGHVQRQWQER